MHLANATSAIIAEFSGQYSTSPTLYMIAWPALYSVWSLALFKIFEYVNNRLKDTITAVFSRVHWLDRYFLKLVGVFTAPFMLIVILIAISEGHRAFMNNHWAQIGAVLIYMHIFLVHMVGPFILRPIYQTIDECKRRIQLTKDMYNRARAFVSNDLTDYVDVRCNICVVNRKDVVLTPCGHTVCHVCVDKIDICPQCRCGINDAWDMYIN